MFKQGVDKMILGEIKIEALRLMFMDSDDEYSIDYLNRGIYMNNEVYKPYLVKMIGSINRCFASIEDKGVLPTQAVTIPLANGFANGQIDLSSIVDYYNIERVLGENKYQYDNDCEFDIVGNMLRIKDYDPKTVYTILYKPKIQRISASTNNDIDLKDIGVPDNIAAYIPYFIKGDLYREDEPAEANEARNWYEQAMAEIMNKQVSRQSRVQSSYSMNGV